METRFYRRIVDELLNESVTETCSTEGNTTKQKKKCKPDDEFDDTVTGDSGEEQASHSVNQNSPGIQEMKKNDSLSKKKSVSGSSTDDNDDSKSEDSSTTSSSSSDDEEEIEPQKKRGKPRKGKSVAAPVRKAGRSKKSDLHSIEKPQQKTDSPKPAENDDDMNAEDSKSDDAVVENLVKPERISDNSVVWKTCLVKITATVLDSSPAAITTQGAIMTRCQHCAQDVEWEKFTKHMYHKHRDMDYTLKCYVCEESFSSYALAKAHVKKVHPSEAKAGITQQEEPRQCPICNRTYQTLQQLNKHTADRHAEGKFKRIRKKQSELSEEQREKNRAMHRRYRANRTEEQRQRERERDRRRALKGRGQQINSVAYRELREYLDNNPEPPLKCPHCPLNHFPTKNSLQIHHSSNHQPKEHVCHLCGKTMTKKNGLQAHLDAVHGSERPFICDQCGASFKRSTHLTMHQTTVHDPEGRKRYQEYTNKMRAFKKLRDMSIQEEEY